MKHILLLETIADPALEILKTRTDFKLYESYNQPISDEELSKIDAVITRGKGQVNIELFNKCPNLKIAARCGVGLDNVNLFEASKRKIKVVNAPGSNAATIAEHTIALMLMLQRNLFHSVSAVKNNNWEFRNTYKGDEIHGKTLGIVGMGNIGLKVAHIADALGLRILYNSKNTLPHKYENVSLEFLLQNSDIISLHVPLTVETSGFIDIEKLSLMKPTAIIINTARGQIVDEKALLDRLNNKLLSGYAADVLSVEPPIIGHALLAHPNVIVTPHSGSLTSTTYTKMCVSTVNNVLRILDNEAPEEGCIFNAKELE